eukprot:m.99295 g.99295  ORF g.99295 m.99295 type:complete len:504 (-) comp27142_c2_seq1:85-1596(-)
MRGSIMTGLVLMAVVSSCTCVIYNIEDLGAVPDADDNATMWKNGGIFNATFPKMRSGDTIWVPNEVFHLYGGIMASDLSNITFQIDGTLSFGNDRNEWPSDVNRKVLESFQFTNFTDLLITSMSRTGTLNGNGKAWWGAIHYLLFAENRPRLLSVINSAGIVLEHVSFKDPAYWTTTFVDIIDVTIRFCNIVVANPDTHDLTAFNTDGFDLSGTNVHIHDCNIWTNDDCVAVKDLPTRRRSLCSANWVVERVNASGLGLTIGSIGTSTPTTCIRNITFRDSTMVNTVKGIYVKTRGPPDNPSDAATFDDILYQNITITKPSQWGIWIGPAQQADSAHACSFDWPNVPDASCPVSSAYTFNNITLRDITIIDGDQSPGIIVANLTNPMTNVVFDNVVAKNPGSTPFGAKGYACFGINGTTRGSTSPIPPCFNGGPQCVANSQCMDKYAQPCCSGRSHETGSCGLYERCGCIASGECADTHAGCCSGKCHSTIDCGVGLGCRCDA